MNEKTPLERNKEKLAQVQDEEASHGLHSVVTPLIHGDLILDIGCGNGHFSKLLPDKSFFHVDCVSRDLPNFTLKDVSNDKLDTYPKLFDDCLLVEILEHLENPFHAVREAKRVSKRIIITTPCVSDFMNRILYLMIGKFFYFFAERYSQHTMPIFESQLNRMRGDWLLEKSFQRRSRKMTKTLIQVWRRPDE